MPVTEGFGAESPANRDWKPVPEGVYQTVIKDIEVKDTQKYQSEEMTTQYLFKLVILDGKNEDSKLQMVVAYVSRSFFKGNSQKGFNQSKLVAFTKSLYKFYYPKLDVMLLEAEDMTDAVINDMIGKQIKVVVKLNADETSNKVTDFMAIDEELEVPEEVKIAPTKLVAKPKISKIADANAATEEKSEEKKDEDSTLPF